MLNKDVVRDRALIRTIKAILIGGSAAFMMFVIVAPLIVFKTGPFNLSPPAAMLHVFGIDSRPLAWILHFAYGIGWGLVYVQLVGKRSTGLSGFGFGLCMWLVMMLIYSPLIGWGLFGLGDAHMLAPDDPMYLAPGYGYSMLTFLLHAMYGVIIGTVYPLWAKVDSL